MPEQCQGSYVCIVNVNNNLEIETNDLTNLLNPNCYDPSGDKWLRIYRVGNIKFLSILLKAKGLTGHETIVTDIPTKLQPASVCYGVAQGRDTGEWAVATYVPVVLTVLNNNSDYLQKARKYGHFTGYKN